MGEVIENDFTVDESWRRCEEVYDIVNGCGDVLQVEVDEVREGNRKYVSDGFEVNGMPLPCLNDQVAEVGGIELADLLNLVGVDDEGSQCWHETLSPGIQELSKAGVVCWRQLQK